MVFSVPIIIITAIAGFKDMMSNTYPLACFLVFWLLFEVVFIANTELMIHNSVALVKLGESQWTFGQTLAMLMLVLPLLGLVKQAIEWNSGKKKVVSDEERGLDEKKENHGKTRSNVVIGGDTMKRDDEIEAVCSTCQKRITNSEQGDGNELVTETWCSLH